MVHWGGKIFESEDIMQSLKGKVAIVTGGVSGIGKGTVEAFVKAGAKVAIADLQDAKGARMAESLGDSVFYCRTDVACEDQVRQLVAHTVDKFGRLDCMFNNAGVGGVLGDLDEIDMQGFDETLGILLKGVFLGYKYAVPVMKAQKSGSIISTGSIAGLMGGFGPQVYSAAKAGVIHLAKSAALELAPYHVRSNAICPGAIATPIFGASFGLGRQVADKMIEPLKKHLASAQPMPRCGVPEDIAQTALFLASDASQFVTGQAIVVDGGLTSGMQRVGSVLEDFIKEASLNDHE